MEALNNIFNEARGSGEEGLCQGTSDITDDHSQSTQEQLAELRLLARQSPASSFSLPSVRTSTTSPVSDLDDIGVTQPDGGDSGEMDRPQHTTGALSNFSAILATSRKMETTLSITSHHNTGSELTLDNGVADQTHASISVEIGVQRPRTSDGLPTLNEGSEGEEDEEDEETPETPSDVAISTCIVALSDAPLSTNTEMDGVKQENEHELEDAGDNGVEFVGMLEHLSGGEIEFLALKAEDLTVRRLERVHAALSTSQPSSPNMPHVRTLVAVDMLRLLFQRLGMHVVRDALSLAMQQFVEREDTATGMDSVHVALLTSNNIASVVLMARRELTAAKPSPTSLSRSSTSSSRHQIRRASHTSPRLSSSSASPSSSRCGTPKSPGADRRSILAREGIHVLMQEKLVSFDYRGQTTAFPAFRVRGGSTNAAELAAKRRQRGLQYANDHVAQRTILHDTIE